MWQMSNSLDAWYVGNLKREDAEKALLHPHNEHGTFLIRNSQTRPNDYSLSVRDGLTVKHYLIRQLSNGNVSIVKRKEFDSLQQLVQYYNTYADGLCVNLRKPCPVFPTLFAAKDNHLWEMDRNILTFICKLGQGQFAEVYRGINRYINVPVAIKKLRPGVMDPQDFVAEAEFMKNLSHRNIIQLFGVCTKEEPIYIITELMEQSLLHYLRYDPIINPSRHYGRNDDELLPRLIRIAAQIAAGMAYLESRNYIHRDLAARNVLLGDNRGDTVKIGDFGLARVIQEDAYQARSGAKFPIKWTAPEAALFNRFSIKSDVWSFGIVLFEIITKGETPYRLLTNEETITKVHNGYRLPEPHGCPPSLYAIMLECWDKDDSKRPTFETLQWKLEDFFHMNNSEYNEAPGADC